MLWMWNSLSRGFPASGDSWKIDTGASMFCHNNWCAIKIAHQTQPWYIFRAHFFYKNMSCRVQISVVICLQIIQEHICLSCSCKFSDSTCTLYPIRYAYGFVVICLNIFVWIHMIYLPSRLLLSSRFFPCCCIVWLFHVARKITLKYMDRCIHIWLQQKQGKERIVLVCIFSVL